MLSLALSGASVSSGYNGMLCLVVCLVMLEGSSGLLWIEFVGVTWHVIVLE